METDALHLVLTELALLNGRRDLHRQRATHPVMYAGGQLEKAGLNQVNIALPASLHGAGPVKLSLVVDGARSNAIALTFQ